MLGRRSVTLLIALLVPVALMAGSWGATSSASPTPVVRPSARASFSGHGSVGQAYVLGAPTGTNLELTDAAGDRVGGGTVDALGSLIIRNVPPGSGYRFRSTSGPHAVSTAGFRVLSPSDARSPSFYSSQQMSAGLNYITMRDGVKLAATVRLPPGKTLADGPFPTVIEESGYAIAAPHSLIDAELHLNGETTSDPLVPDTATGWGR